MNNLPRLIFSLNTGRCGTAYLAQVLGTIPGVFAAHEPPPDFVDVFRPLIHNRKAYKTWLAEKKLSYLQWVRKPVYAESSHLFVQGFVEPLLDLGVIPDIIILRRPRRDVALSMWRKREWPSRIDLGRCYRLQPNDPGVFLHCDNWSEWTDYQMCYWHCLEIERRIQEYVPMLENAGSLIVETSLGELMSEAGFIRLADDLGLPKPDQEKYDAVKNRRYNVTPDQLRSIWPGGDIMRQEQELEAVFGL